MRAVVQRVSAARVEVAGETVGAIERGLCAFVGAGRDDTAADVTFLADKLATLRVFPDAQGKMSLAVGDVGGAVLVVSQFTLYGDVRRGRRPSFDAAMAPEPARALCDAVVAALRARGLTVATGRFAADMRVVVDNDGPVTILVDSRKAF
ncbi:MAG: D-tyrosyl-tRNA(Tyr) deacylase [Myxococcales bacterium]|nr:D-tyrosyl-tRNA(Tyr) deacylase [Myxococcales bacterium]